MFSDARQVHKHFEDCKSLSSQLTQLAQHLYTESLEFDLDVYRLDYEKARTNYIKVENEYSGLAMPIICACDPIAILQAAEALKLAEGPYEASRDAYVAAVRKLEASFISKSRSHCTCILIRLQHIRRKCTNKWVPFKQKATQMDPVEPGSFWKTRKIHRILERLQAVASDGPLALSATYQ
jgi:hypothetical protein